MKHQYFTRIFLIVISLNFFYKPASAQNFHLVKDINSSTDARPTNYNNSLYNYNKGNVYAVLNGISYFTAFDGINGKGLWRSDGTEAGTYQVKAGVFPTEIAVSNGKLYFAGSGNPGL